MSLNSQGATNEEAFTSANINKHTIRFRPGNLFKGVVDNAGFEKVATMPRINTDKMELRIEVKVNRFII
jgi:hypothetical protein